MQYKCIRSFKAIDGSQFYYGEKISSMVYWTLRQQDQRNFQKVEEEEPVIPKRESTDSYFNTTLYSVPDFPDTPQSNSNFEIDTGGSQDSDSSRTIDYGGGDSGGAGATGDY
jgi:uncharacterized membrane protein YgcG